MTLKRIALVFGGRSSEHEISLLSAGNIYKAIDKNKYEVFLIGIDKNGVWSLQEESIFKTLEEKLPALNKSNQKLVALVKTEQGAAVTGICGFDFPPVLMDLAFPALHGPYGEDGTIQGLFKMVDLPFVGPDEKGSALAMDKEVMKRLFREADIPSADYICVEPGKEQPSYKEAARKLSDTMFIKPARQGSSVGVFKVTGERDFLTGLQKALKYDSKVLIEECVIGRELECSVLGNQNPQASVLGEIIPSEEYGFYSYEAKYINEKGATLSAPAKLDPDLQRRMQELALRTFKTLYLEGMSRVDFFLREDGKFLINEVNTIPGFTAISMYPRLWGCSGIDYPDLIDKLLKLALERHTS